MIPFSMIRRTTYTFFIAALALSSLSCTGGGQDKTSSSGASKPGAVETPRHIDRNAEKLDRETASALILESNEASKALAQEGRVRLELWVFVKNISSPDPKTSARIQFRDGLIEKRVLTRLMGRETFVYEDCPNSVVNMYDIVKNLDTSTSGDQKVWLQAWQGTCSVSLGTWDAHIATHRWSSVDVSGVALSGIDAEVDAMIKYKFSDTWKKVLDVANTSQIRSVAATGQLTLDDLLTGDPFGRYLSQEALDLKEEISVPYSFVFKRYDDGWRVKSWSFKGLQF